MVLVLLFKGRIIRKVMGWGRGAIFESQEFFFRYQVPCMNFFYAVAWTFFKVNFFFII